jgi:hypothetical protein
MVEASGLLPQARRRGLWEKAWPGAETVAQGQEEGERSCPWALRLIETDLSHLVFVP